MKPELTELRKKTVKQVSFFFPTLFCRAASFMLFIIILANNGLLHVAVPLVLQTPLQVFTKNGFQSSFSRLCGKYLLVLTEHLKNLNSMDQFLTLVITMDTYIFTLWGVCMPCIYWSFISEIYIHTHHYSNNTAYKSFQVIISGPRNPIHYFGPLRFPTINLWLVWHEHLPFIFPQEKLTGNTLAQASLICILSMLKTTGKALPEKLRCLFLSGLVEL